MDPLLDTFDEFVDDLISSNVNLLNGELDFLIFQHLLNSFDLDVMQNKEYQDENSLAA